MFSLQEAEVRLVNVNVRPEMHGEEPVTAVDLKCETSLANTALAMFSPDLKRALYRRDDDKPDLFAEDEQHLTKRRFPQLGVLKWEHELVGAAARFHLGFTGKSDIDLAGIDVNDFRLEPLEGGSVTVTFRIQGKPDEAQLGRLGMLAGHDMTLTITPPTPTPDVTVEEGDDD